MGSLSLTHWAIVAIAAMLLFGGGRVSSALGDLGRGLGQLKRGIADEPASQPRD